MAGESQKPRVFEYLFEQRFDATTSHVEPVTVTSADLQDVIVLLKQEEGIGLSVSNPANFLKDYLRSSRRNALWPELLKSNKFTARQAYGQGRVFDFVPYSSGQTEPFPDEFLLPADAPLHRIESVSMPSAARALGRRDEAWLIQVCVHQRVLQTHFALFSQIDAADLFHLQNSLKGTPEIDAVFLLSFRAGNETKKAIVTFEAKRDEPILGDQVKSQVAFMAKQTSVRPGLRDITHIVPVAANTIVRDGTRVVAIFEMSAIAVDDGIRAHDAGEAHTLPLTIASAVGYSFEPPVSGI